MTPRPSVSVVVTAYNRRSYLKQAVTSVLRQTAPHAEIETIVVKNFHDEDLDSFLSEAGVTVIDDSSEALGSSLVTGISASRGEIICFLDDDDEYGPERLSQVISRFTAEPSLIYLRNGCTFIDPDGRELTGADRVHPQNSRPLRMQSPPDRFLKLRESYASHAGSFPSCISIRSSIMKRFLPNLAKVWIGPDNFFLYCALVSEGTLGYEPGTWTRYRVHSESTSKTEVQRPNERRSNQRRTELASTILGLTEGTQFEELGRLYVAQAEFVNFLCVLDARPPTIPQHIALLRYWIRFRVPYHGFLLACALLKRIAPSAGALLFVRRETILHSLVQSQ